MTQKPGEGSPLGGRMQSRHGACFVPLPSNGATGVGLVKQNQLGGPLKQVCRI
jgi:hypothetical protein